MARELQLGSTLLPTAYTGRTESRGLFVCLCTQMFHFLRLKRVCSRRLGKCRPCARGTDT